MSRAVTFPNQTSLCALGQGTWEMGDDPALRSEEIRILQMGLDLGMTVIDIAEMYGDGRAEILVGEAIAGRRHEVFLVSKVLPSNASRKGTIAACEGSLKRLNTDYLDLYLLHWKGGYPFSETIDAMNALMKAGKIRQWGVSNISVNDMQRIISLEGGASCATNQVLYNLMRRGIEYDLIPWCTENQMPIMAYSPIEQGRLLNHPAIQAIAARHNATVAQIALAWTIRLPGILSIPKAGSVKHVQENARALSIELTKEELAQLDRAFPPPIAKTPLEVL